MQRDDVPAARTGAATLDPAASPAAPQIAPLTHLKDYKVAKEDPDVRGWPLIARDGRTVGKVHDLLVDTAALRVRYLDVELERDLVASAPVVPGTAADRKSTRLNSSHANISYAVFCLKKKTQY